MRRRSCVWLSAFLALSCGDDTHIVPATVSWMEWPAEVVAGEPFKIRLVGFAPFCGPNDGFVATPQVADSTVTFQPYFIVPDRQSPCPFTEQQLVYPFVAPSFDTSTVVPGLAAPSPRSYDIRARLAVVTPGGSGFAVKTFGTVAVRGPGVHLARHLVVFADLHCEPLPGLRRGEPARHDHVLVGIRTGLPVRAGGARVRRKACLPPGGAAMRTS